MRMWPIVGFALMAPMLSAPVTAQSTGTQGFSVVLVLGDLQDGSTPDNIPPAARAAIGDLRDFLPYKSYRVLDTAWILGSTTQLYRASSRLRGVDNQTYDVSLTSSPGSGASPPLQMKFVMREGGRDQPLRGLNPDHPEARKYQLQAEREAQLKAELLELVASRAALQKDLATTNNALSAEDRKARAADVTRQLRELQIAIDTRQHQLEASGGNGQMLIDTSFSMRLGETVVVGTSRVRGDKALIVLLTAVRK
jgi:hypothetical protein